MHGAVEDFGRSVVPVKRIPVQQAIEEFITFRKGKTVEAKVNSSWRVRTSQSSITFGPPEDEINCRQSAEKSRPRAALRWP
jgi:hypothetical protein